MTTCPNCNEELQLDSSVGNNVYTYGRSAMGRAMCCGKGVVVSRTVTLHYRAYEGSATEDDWGVKIKPAKENSK